MLQITIPAVPDTWFWDEVEEEFLSVNGDKERTLRLEHSLVSLSKWESKWCEPFISDKEKTTEQIIDYVKHMTITQNVPDKVYERLDENHIKEIMQYIEAPMTATTFGEDKEKNKKTINGEKITAEIIYYWMIALNIPSEYQKWHLNKLITLIRVISKKNEPPKKMSMDERRALNAARRKKHNTRG